MDDDVKDDAGGDEPLDLGWTHHMLAGVQMLMHFYGPTNRLERIERYLILRSLREE